MVGSPDIFLFGIYDPDIQGIDLFKAVPNKLVLCIVFNVSSRDMTFPPGPGFNDNVQNHGFPRFRHFVKRNGPDTGAIMTHNVILVISVHPILYQLPYGAFIFVGPFFHEFSINYTIPLGPQKRIPYRTPAVLQ